MNFKGNIVLLKTAIYFNYISIDLGWKGNPFLDKITPNKNIPSKYCLSC